MGDGKNPRLAEPRYYWSIEHRCDPETLRMAKRGVQPLAPDQVRALDVRDLVRRMDALRVARQLATYPGVPLTFFDSLPLVEDVTHTRRFAELEEGARRALVDAAFRFLVQTNLLMVCAGLHNRLIYDDHQYSPTVWQTPRLHSVAAMLGQYDLIGSRIALECFFDLTHLAENGSRMSGDSKFKAFAKWMKERPPSPFAFFLGHIVDACRFSRRHRDPEVHGTSAFVHSYLALATPPNVDGMDHHRLTNILLNLWLPFVQILDGGPPRNASHGPDAYSKIYVQEYWRLLREGDAEALGSHIDAALAELKEAQRSG